MNGILPILGIVFIVLKLVGVIAWSWWWVLSPFIATFALVIFGVLMAAIVIRSGSKW